MQIYLSAQTGGVNSFSFLNIEISARTEAMGGNTIALYNDLPSIQTTPSLLNKDMHNQLVFLFGDYFADINLVGFSYARFFEQVGVVALSVKAVDYGEFELNDEFGNINGNFNAHDEIVTFSLSRRLSESLFLGTNVNFLNSVYASYNSMLVSTNISTTYHDYSKKFTSTLLLKNIGRQINRYTNTSENLPFEIQLGISKKLKYLPFQYHIVYENINDFYIDSPYKLASQTNFETGLLEVKEEMFLKTFLRHVIIGGELNPFRKSLFFRGGFNFQRRFDMSLLSNPGFVGFSWGIGFRFAKFSIDYSRSSYHLSGTPNNFSFAVDFNKILIK